jgi:hypothetical protein
LDDGCATLEGGKRDPIRRATVSKSHEPTQRLDRRIERSIQEEIRIDLLRIFSERAATPRELAETLQENLNEVLDHVIDLWANRCIDTIEEVEPGADPADLRYRIIPFFVDDRAAEELPREEREELAATILQAIVAEALGGLRTGSIAARSDIHLSMKATRLDERGWRELMALLARTLKEAETIEESCRERLGLRDEEGFEVFFAMMGFERSASRAD